MSDSLMRFYDDCFVTKYKRVRGLVSQNSHDSIMTLGRNNNKQIVTNNVDYFSFKLTENQLYQCWKIIHRKLTMKDVKVLNKSQYNENLYNNVEDLMLLIPSTSSKRLENSAWRAWAKERFQLDELNPAELNWYKENDITWLYGPLIMNENEDDIFNTSSKMNLKSTTKFGATKPQITPSSSTLTNNNNNNDTRSIHRTLSSESLSSLSSSTESISSMDTASTSITSEDLTNFHSKPVMKPILKTSGNQFDSLWKMGQIGFNSISNSEETLIAGNDSKRKRVSFSNVMEKREIIGEEIFDYNLEFIDNERIGCGYHYNL